VTDAALTHALLSLVALHVDLQKGQQEITGPTSKVHDQVIYHQVEAIKGVNKRLTTLAAFPTDAIIGAVALLANCAVGS
jgi:hypothetical protein